MISDRLIKLLLGDGPLTTLGEDLVERLFMVAPKEELLERSLKLTLLDDDRPGAPAFTPPFHFQHNAKTLYLWWLCHRDHNCLRAVAVRGTLNLLQKYEDQFGLSLLQFTIANTKEVVHQIVSSGLTPVMIRRHQDNLIDFCYFCRLHTYCRVKNHWQLFERALKKTAQSNDIFFTSYEDLVSPKLSTVCLTEGKHGSILPQIIALLIFKGAEVSDTIDYGLRYIQNRDLGDHRLRITTRHGVRSLRLSDREEELLK